jgi:hypothetical protein
MVVWALAVPLVAVTTAFPQLVVLAVNVVLTSPGSVTPLVGLTDPGPLALKVTAAPVTGLLLPSTKWKVNVQLAPSLAVEQAWVTVPDVAGGG